MKSLVFVLSLLSIFFSSMMSAQDKLVFNNEKVEECKVLEITPEVIKYTKHTMPDGPIYTIYKKEVNSIVFENGEIELIHPAVHYTSKAEARRVGSAEWPVYKASWGLDLISPAFGEFRTWFEVRNDKNTIGHTISLIGFWDRYGYYYDDYLYEDCIDCIDYYYGYGGGFAFTYAPRFYFIDHKIVRPFAGPEVAMGMVTNYNPSGYFHGMARVGVAITPKPKFNITLDVAGGGYVAFDGYSNWGEGLITLGLSLGVNFGDGTKKKGE